MKKTLMIVASIIACQFAIAQDTDMQVELGVNVGTASFVNYPAVSLFDDNTASYLCMTEALHVGIVNPNGTMYGLQFGRGLVNTAVPAVKEASTLYNLTLLTRRYYPLAGRTEALFGVSLGGIMAHNTYQWGGDNKSQNRYGLRLGYELGLNYRMSSKDYIGLLGTFYPVSGWIGSHTTPAGLAPNRGNQTGGYSITLQYGLVF